MQKSQSNNSALLPPDHPIYNPRAMVIDTPMLTGLEETVLSWLWCGRAGGIVLGDARHGKSTAAREVSPRLRTRCGEPVSSVYISLAKRDLKTITAVFRNLWFSIHNTVKTRATSDELAYDLVNYLADEACLNANRQVVIIVDEAQYLSISQYDPFMELGEKLLAIGVSLMVVFIANCNEYDRFVEEVRTEEALDKYRGRFFNDCYYFTGLQRVENVKACLLEYDNYKYPESNKKTLTEVLRPYDAPDGWEICSLAPLLWEIFNDEYRKPLGLRSWGMQYFTTTVNTLLLDYFPRYGLGDYEERGEMIRHCINVSGVVPSNVKLAS